MRVLELKSVDLVSVGASGFLFPHLSPRESGGRVAEGLRSRVRNKQAYL